MPPKKQAANSYRKMSDDKLWAAFKKAKDALGAAADVRNKEIKAADKKFAEAQAQHQLAQREFARRFRLETPAVTSTSSRPDGQRMKKAEKEKLAEATRKILKAHKGHGMAVSEIVAKLKTKGHEITAKRLSTTALKHLREQKMTKTRGKGKYTKYLSTAKT